jgi:thymidylate kinase
MATFTGKFIVLDGTEGSGKSTVVDYWKKCLEAEGKKIFDLKAYWRQYDKQPLAEEVLAAPLPIDMPGKIIARGPIKT